MNRRGSAEYPAEHEQELYHRDLHSGGFTAVCGTWLLFPGVVSCSPGWPVRREAAKGINWMFLLLNDGWALLKLQRGVPMEGFSALKISVPPPEGPADLLM